MADRLGWKDDLLQLIEKVEAAKGEAVEAKANAAKAEQNVAAVQPEVVKQHGGKLHLGRRPVCVLYMYGEHHTTMPGYQITIRQEEILINFMERHPRLVSKSGELDGDFTVAKRNDLWGELAALLNSEGPPTKTESQWKVWWSKYLYKVRREAAVVAGEMRATGGGRLGGNKGRVLALVGRGSGGGLGPAYFMSDDSEESHSESSGQAIAATSEPGTSGTGGASRPAKSPAPRAVPAAEPRVQARPRRGPATSRRQPPRQRSEEELLEQVVLDGGRSVNVLQSQVTIQRDILAQVTRLAEASERTASALEHLVDVVGRHEARLQLLQQEVAPLSSLAAAMAHFLQRQAEPQEPPQN
ncbi:hypothetical protein HPB49_006968 [Dermacentor silvarum]|uniref:Uncharacterized protein n=1 Tax=Dermacentor silvarum TaxID=543639 RepID=A0ACB8CDU5_DERSI|nr:hypothetical protein HPB49_006968 [Dermacentor silvarum]